MTTFSTKKKKRNKTPDKKVTEKSIASQNFSDEEGAKIEDNKFENPPEYYNEFGIDPPLPFEETTEPPEEVD